jgi:hypothetical protein
VLLLGARGAAYKTWNKTIKIRVVTRLIDAARYIIGDISDVYFRLLGIRKRGVDGPRMNLLTNRVTS